MEMMAKSKNRRSPSVPLIQTGSVAGLLAMREDAERQKPARIRSAV
jgi:hypothetical protein